MYKLWKEEIGAEVVTWTDVDETPCNCSGIMDIKGAIEYEKLEV